MRALFTLVLSLCLTLGCFANEPNVEKVISVTSDMVIGYTFDRTSHRNDPDQAVYTVWSGGAPVVTTKGDPIIMIGGVKLGHWPDTKITYRLADGYEILGFADSPNGSTRTLEVFRPDGTMLRIRGLDTGHLSTHESCAIVTWLYKKTFKPRTFVLDLRD